MQYLLDTGVLLRLFDRQDAAHAEIRFVLRSLRANGDSFAVCTQNISEFWNVSTRPPAARGGYGQSVSITERRVQFIERSCTVLHETPATFQAWRKLVVQQGLVGLAVHDARLVAAMQTASITHILTLNGKDFARYADIVVVSPGDLAASNRRVP